MTDHNRFMTGYKIIVTEYSGKVTGDDVIYTNKEAADYLFAQQNQSVRTETSPEVKLEKVTYTPRPNSNEGVIGRMLHTLNNCTRRDCVRETALSKLTQEEINAIQDLQ